MSAESICVYCTQVSSDIQQLHTPVACCFLTFAWKCVLPSFPVQLICIYFSVQFVFYIWAETLQRNHACRSWCFHCYFSLLKLWPQLLSDCLEWECCVLNVNLVRCVLWVILATWIWRWTYIVATFLCFSLSRGVIFTQLLQSTLTDFKWHLKTFVKGNFWTFLYNVKQREMRSTGAITNM